MLLLTKVSKKSRGDFYNYGERHRVCDLWRVSHAFEDKTKNRHHHSTHARFMTRLRRKAKTNNFF